MKEGCKRKIQRLDNPKRFDTVLFPSHQYRVTRDATEKKRITYYECIYCKKKYKQYWD